MAPLVTDKRRAYMYNILPTPIHGSYNTTYVTCTD